MERPGVGVIEAVPVVPRVEEGQRSPRGGGRHVDAEALIQGDGQKVPPGGLIGLAPLELVLRGEGEAPEVLQGFDPVRSDAGRVELAPIEGAAVIGMLHLGPQPLLL